MKSLVKRTRLFLALFRRDEDGAIFVFTLFILLLMLIVSGMAVDFMRFESRRAALQGCVDNAVLAAANLDRAGTESEVRAIAEDWAEAGDCQGNLDGPAFAKTLTGQRTVSATAKMPVNTFFLRLVGIDSLTAAAEATAIEGIGNIEISLVIDISGSMRFNDRIVELKKAAQSFAGKVLDPANGGTVSLNIIPYAGQTNPGRYMFDYIAAQRQDTYLLSAYEALYDDDAAGVMVPYASLNAFLDDNGIDPDHMYPNVSSCLEMEHAQVSGGVVTDARDFGYSGLPPVGRAQVPHFMNWAISPDGDMDWGWCPQDDTSIRYAQQVLGDKTVSGTLAHWIENLQMHDGTGTHYGMKYGLALLDPTSQDEFTHLVGKGEIPSDFDGRPSAYNDGKTLKYIVLMTDGKITEQVRPVDGLAEENLVTALRNQSSSNRTNIASASENIQSFYALCNLAKDPTRNVVVYTVAFEAPSDAQTQMENCASSPGHFNNTSGAGLTDVFNAIAEQITELRLTE